MSLMVWLTSSRVAFAAPRSAELAREAYAMTTAAVIVMVVAMAAVTGFQCSPRRLSHPGNETSDASAAAGTSDAAGAVGAAAAGGAGVGAGAAGAGDAGGAGGAGGASLSSDMCSIPV